MQSPSPDSVVMFGTLQADGTVHLDSAPQMPPGPIQVTIRAIARPVERLPDLPVEDSSILPPLELPRSGIVREVQPVRVLQRLPDPQDEAA